VTALVDTSVLVEHEGAPRGRSDLPDEWAISAATLAELYLGVLQASTQAERSARLRTLAAVERRADPLPFDHNVARTFAEIVAEARSRGRKPRAMDAIIAATAIRYELPLYTYDRDFSAFAGLTVLQP